MIKPKVYVYFVPKKIELVTTTARNQLKRLSHDFRTTLYISKEFSKIGCILSISPPSTSAENQLTFLPLDPV